MTRILVLWALSALALLSVEARAQSERPGPDGLVDQAWGFLPVYDGEHRSFLTEVGRGEVSAAAHLFEAALSLDSAHLRALWSLGHAEVLLSEDRRNRGFVKEAAAHSVRAITSLGRAIELQQDDPWAWYARGTARTAAGLHGLALGDLERALELIDARDDQLDWLRYKVLGWLAEVQMRGGRHAAARESLRAYHAEFSTNEWPLHIALAESHLRERDLAGARRRYLAILDGFPSDHQAFALLGYLAGLRGDHERATTRLTEAIERELEPGVYTRLWLLILATDEARQAAAEDLASFLENPPPGPTEWDLALARFALGAEGVPAFLERLRLEKERRMEAAETLDDLECEGWYYVGLRRELDASALEGEQERRELLGHALEGYRRALSFSPVAWKWEWAFARLRFADLALELGRTSAPQLSSGDGQVALSELSAHASSLRWHAPRADGATAELGREPRPGDLVLATLALDPDGPVEARRLLVDVAD